MCSLITLLQLFVETLIDMSYYVVVGRWTSEKILLFVWLRLIIGNPWKSMVKALVLGKLGWALYYEAAYIIS